MRNIILSFFLFAFACNINSCTQKTKDDKIKNGIEIHEDGLSVQEAFLTNGNSSMISDDNKVQPGERVSLRMIINGWKEVNGRVFMDASQKVSTSSGVILTTNSSLFGSTLMYGTTPENASQVLLYQTIGSFDQTSKYVLISFKVWDKTTNKSVSGSYKLYMQ